MTLNLIEAFKIRTDTTKHTKNTKRSFLKSIFPIKSTFVLISVFRLILWPFPKPPGINIPPKKTLVAMNPRGLVTLGRGYCACI